MSVAFPSVVVSSVGQVKKSFGLFLKEEKVVWEHWVIPVLVNTSPHPTEDDETSGERGGGGGGREGGRAGVLGRREGGREGGRGGGKGGRERERETKGYIVFAVSPADWFADFY